MLKLLLVALFVCISLSSCTMDYSTSLTINSDYYARFYCEGENGHISEYEVKKGSNLYLFAAGSNIHLDCSQFIITHDTTLVFDNYTYDNGGCE